MTAPAGSPVRTLAIGDIHGCRFALENLVEYAGISGSDTVVTLGDYVDRGPDSMGVIAYLMELGTGVKLVALRGNHEVMMLEAREDEVAFSNWLGFGGDATVASYGIRTLAEIPAEHWEFLEGLRGYYEEEGFFFVHANADPGVPLEDQADYALYWERFEHPARHRSGKTMVCGHTSQRTGRILDLGHAVCIDTFIYGGGWLTCLEVASGRYWQTNEKGERREGARAVGVGNG